MLRLLQRLPVDGHSFYQKPEIEANVNEMITCTLQVSINHIVKGTRDMFTRNVNVRPFSHGRRPDAIRGKSETFRFDSRCEMEKDLFLLCRSREVVFFVAKN